MDPKNMTLDEIIKRDKASTRGSSRGGRGGRGGFQSRGGRDSGFRGGSRGGSFGKSFDRPRGGFRERERPDREDRFAHRNQPVITYFIFIINTVCGYR